MRFKSFINENYNDNSELIKKIKDECSYYFELAKDRNRYLPLFRAIDGNYGIKKFNTVKNRKPRDTPIRIHNALGKLFKKKFGWDARSEGVFCSGNDDNVVFYGDYLYFMVPVGKFRFVYNDRINDLTAILASYEFIENGEDATKDLTNKELMDDLSFIVDEYEDHNLKHAIKMGCEISIKCNSYYMINTAAFYSYSNTNTYTGYFTDMFSI